MTMIVNPRIKWRWEGDKVLLNTLAIMNKTAGEVLELLETTNDTKKIADILHGRYPSVSLDKLESDVEVIVSQFQKFNIIVPEEYDAESLLTIHATCTEDIASVFNNTLSAPVGVACMLTYNCNQKCLHCYTLSPVKVSNELKTHEWKRVLDELSELRVFYTIFAGGEPLVYRDIIELVDYASNKRLNPAIATNAYLLNERKIEELITAGIRGFLISLDGATAEVHDTFRRSKGSFDRTVSAVSVLVEKEIDAVVLATITQMNVHQITDIMELADKMGVRRLSLVKLRKSGRAVSNYDLQLSPHEYVELLKKIYEKEQELQKTSVLYPDLPAAYFEKSIGVNHYEELKASGRIELCGAGIVGCVVSPSGDMRPCDASGDISVGNVRENSVKHIWDTSVLFKKLREIKKSDIHPCNTCRLHDTCLMGCRALPVQVGDDGDIYRADPLCEECYTTFGGEK